MPSKTKALRDVEACAIIEAESLGHSYLGTEHYLLAMLKGNGPVKGANSVAQCVLTDLKLDYKQVRDHLIEMIGDARKV